MSVPTPDQTPWEMVRRSLTRPYPVSVPMVVLVSLVPVYLFLDRIVPGRTRHLPELFLDRLIPLMPAWALIYGALYVFLIGLPFLVVTQQEHIRRTVRAYLFVWLTAYAIFVLYPTSAPRPDEVTGTGFAVWGLRSLYSSDPPINCFPSLHVAHSFVSALTCFRVHRGVGLAATLAAALVAISTLFTKQHYAVDAVAGVTLAYAAYLVFLKNDRGETIPEIDRRVAPILAVGFLGVVGIGVAGFWVAYRLTAVG